VTKAFVTLRQLASRNTNRINTFRYSISSKNAINFTRRRKRQNIF